MNKKAKNNVILFPNKMAENIAEKVMENIDIQEECAELGRFCVDIIQKTLRNDPRTLMSDLDFNDIKSDEYKDMFVILNLIVSMFLRKSNIDHLLQRDLNDLYMKLLTIDFAAKNNVDWDEFDQIHEFEDADDLPPIG